MKISADLLLTKELTRNGQLHVAVFKNTVYLTMSCTDCPNTLINQQEQLNNIMSQAKQFAINQQQNVFIYNEEGTLRFISEEAGREAGIQPTHGVVSFMQPVTA